MDGSEALASELARKARSAADRLAELPSDTKDAALRRAADGLEEARSEILEANRRPAHQEIFHLRYGESHSIRQIAAKVGKSNEAVKVSLRRSRAVLSDNVPELAIVLENVAQSA